MYKQLLTKKFFADNPYMENSAQRFIYSTLLYEELEDIANEITIKQEMKKLYPGETYDQGPLLALHELNCRLYEN